MAENAQGGCRLKPVCEWCTQHYGRSLGDENHSKALQEGIRGISKVAIENLESSFATEHKDGSENRIGGLASRFSVESPCQSMNLRAFPPKTPGSGPEFYLHLNFFFLSKEKNYK